MKDECGRKYNREVPKQISHRINTVKKLGLWMECPLFCYDLYEKQGILFW
jgi:hypothetical protein